MDKEFKNKLRDKVVTENENSPTTDGNHIILSCSNCNKSLLDIWLTKPDADISFKMTASCGFCGDKSWSQIIEGGFHLGITQDTKMSSIDQVYDDEDVKSGKVDAAYMITTTDDRHKFKQEDNYDNS